jgi:regulator of sirC expression with transglutaminase-like and TPR domain
VRPLDAFAELLARDDSRIDLAQACLMIAQDAYPGLEVERYLGEIERMATRLRGRTSQVHGAAHSAEERVMALNQFLFDELGYRGNTEAYYDPRNSYLNEVMDRRIGIPITLAVLYMAVGRRIGLPLEGVSFPGHFLVRLRLRGGMLVLDPFDGGAPLAEDDLRERLERVIPKGAAGNVPVAELPLDQFLEPATPRQILARVLRNLKGIYRAAAHARGAQSHARRRARLERRAARPRHRVSAAGVLSGRAEGPVRLHGARARGPRLRGRPGEADGGLRAMRPA